MNRYDALERELTAWFVDTAMPRTPDYTNDIVQLTATQRQRPRWTFPERWLPMSVITLVPRSARPVPWRTLGTLVLLALLLATVVIVYVGSQQRLPGPFGLASNGLVAYAQDGDILTVDPATGARAWITSGNEDDREARWSLDGSRLAFLRVVPVPPGVERPAIESIVIVDRAGKVVAKSGPLANIDIDAFAWSPDGRSIAVAGISVFGVRSLHVIETADGTMSALPVGYAGLDVYWRPGAERELLFQGYDQNGSGLMVADVDDPTGARLAVRAASGTTLRPNGWTPDGRRVVYTSIDESLYDDPKSLRLHVLELATGNEIEIPIAHGHVSNDGSRILGLGVDGPCVVPIEGGMCVPIAPPEMAYEGGFASGAHWAPDDRWILVRETDMNSAAFLLDPSGGNGERPAWLESGGESWQRRAP